MSFLAAAAVFAIKIPVWVIWIVLQCIGFVFQKILHAIFD